MHSEQIEKLESQLKASDELRGKLVEKLKWWVELKNETKGVHGYHLNGAIAEWDYFEDKTEEAIAQNQEYESKKGEK